MVYTRTGCYTPFKREEIPLPQDVWAQRFNTY
jgi:hypothetical protein